MPPGPKEVFDQIVSEKGLNFEGKEDQRRWDRHKGFFLKNRAQVLAAFSFQIFDLKTRLNFEYDQVEQFVNSKLGTDEAPGPLAGGVDTVDPGHLDLDDVSKRYEAELSPHRSAKPAKRKKKMLERRKNAVIGIVWRAAAIHDDLWGVILDENQPMNEPLLEEMLDRRLRIIERMAYNVARAQWGGPEAWGGRIWNLSGDHGPWKDGIRVRMFEYPRIPCGKGVDAVLGRLPAEWELNTSLYRYEYIELQADWKNNPRTEGFRFPETLAAHRLVQNEQWIADDSADDEGYSQFIEPHGVPRAPTAADVIDDLFTPALDWWDRTWMWCDHVLAALQIEAMLFGKRRRYFREHHRKGGDEALNDLVTNPPAPHHAKGYAGVYATVGGGDENKLMYDDADPFFLNGEVAGENLEIGDQLVFWSSHIYQMITSGDWALENALVMDIDSRYRFATNINYVPKIKLQGHGTTEKELGPYANEIVKNMSAALRKKQQKIEGRHLQGEPFVRWAPYEDIAAPPGPWWLPIPQSEFRKWGATSIEEAILGAKKAVGQITDHEGKKLVFLLNGQKTTVKVAAGYHDPADTTSIYFPMFEPTIPGGWGAYLKKRSDVPGHRPHLILKRVAADASIVPGIFKKGFPDLIRVVRPKVDR